MGLNLLNSDWLNSNATRNYPMLDSASLADDSGNVLSRGLIVDLGVSVPIGYLNPGRVFVSQVGGFGAGVTITLASMDAPSVPLATASIYTADHNTNDSYPVYGVGSELVGIIGRITIGPKASLIAASATNYTFVGSPENSQVVVNAVRPMVGGVRGVSVGGVVLDGVVSLQSGSNISFEVQGNTLIIHSGLLSPPDAEDDDCGCTDDTALGDPIRTINLVQPDEEGNIVLTPDNCISITEGEAELVIEDGCSTPCCGCDQLNAIFEAKKAIEAQILEMGEVEEQLRSRLDNLVGALNAAALNPPAGGRDDRSWAYPEGT